MPMIARWPGTIASDSVTDHPSAFWDFLPTACDIAGVEVPDGIDGISYLPTLLGKPYEQEKHEYLYWASTEGETSVGIRQGKWKLGKYKPKRQKRKGKAKLTDDGPEDWRLYDLSTDIGEENDIAAEHPEMVKKLKGLALRDGLAVME